MSEDIKSAESQATRKAAPKSPENLKRLDKLNQAADRIDREEKAMLSIDFDQALKEHEKGSLPILVTLKGRRFKLPGNIPFSYMLWYFNNVKENGGKLKIDPNETPEYLLKIFGGEFMAFITKQNVSFDFVVNKMVPSIMEKWNSGGGEVEEKNELTPGSLSGDGVTSKPTSRDSMV